jgi:hypothetical protein
VPRKLLRNWVESANRRGADNEGFEARARHELASWREDYNTIRPHSSLGQMTPADARSRCRIQCLLDATGRGARAIWGLRAPARCSTESYGLKCRTDSTYRWMKIGAQVNICFEHHNSLVISDHVVRFIAEGTRTFWQGTHSQEFLPNR